MEGVVEVRLAVGNLINGRVMFCTDRMRGKICLKVCSVFEIPVWNCMLALRVDVGDC